MLLKATLLVLSFAVGQWPDVIDQRCVDEGQKFARAYPYSASQSVVAQVEKECMDRVLAGLPIETFEQKQQARAERERREMITVFSLLGLSALVGGWLAWNLGKPSRGGRRKWWVGSALYLPVSVSILPLAVQEVHDALTASLLLHAIWIALLLAVVFRLRIKAAVSAAVASGWGRLGIVAWVLWAGFWGYDLLRRSYIYEKHVFTALGWGLLAPLIAILVSRWIIAGFKHTPASRPSVPSEPSTHPARELPEEVSPHPAASTPSASAPAASSGSVSPSVVFAASPPVESGEPAAGPLVASPEASTEPAATPPERKGRGLAVLRNIGLTLISLVVMGLVLGPAKQCGREVGRASGRIIGAAARPALPDAWTVEWVDSTFGAKLSKGFGAELSQAERTFIVNCLVGKLTAVMPGGPRRAEVVGESRFRDVSKQAGAECGKDFADWVMSGETWTPSAAALVVKMCEAGAGSNPAFCACVSREAPKLYLSPAAFSAENSGGNTERQDTARLKKIADRCSRHLKPR